MEVEPKDLGRTRFVEESQEVHFGQVNFELLKQVKAGGDKLRNHQDLLESWEWMLLPRERVHRGSCELFFFASMPLLREILQLLDADQMNLCFWLLPLFT